ncbi:DoxX family protein [Flavobacteriaceae bacterium]|jgi:putative oxidoreductase|nr:DoxX family protein [Flavobacteriaceae bacterium]MDC1493021.1 DoxX family protein [Flavobacteriaceae bacterium]
MNINFQLLIVRLVFAGLMIINHGFKYLLQLWPFNDISVGSKTLFGLSAFLTAILYFIGEFLAPLFVLIGYNSKVSSLVCMFTMILAIILKHSNEPFTGGEMALLYLTGFLVIFLMGPGKYSVNKK